MENEVDPEVFKATQNSLGKYVKRPPLSEKLLKKPPFRFLHDIVTTVLKTTGFFEGLFEQDELISENVKDRESKIIFLSKVIHVVGSTTGKTLTIKPSKIVAGQEAEKTNLLLQTLAEALDQNLSSKDAVQKYKETTKVSQIAAKTKTDKPETIKKESTKKTNDAKKPLPNEKSIKSSNEKTKTKTNKLTVNKTKEKEATVIKDTVTKKTSQTKLKDKTKSIDKPSKNVINDVEKSTHKNKISLQQPAGDNTINNDDSSTNKEFINNSFNSENKDKEEKHESFMTEDNIFNSSLSSTDLMPVENEVLEVENSPEKEKATLNLDIKDKSENQNQIEHSTESDNAPKDELIKPNSGVLDPHKKVEPESKDLIQNISSKKLTSFRTETEVNVVRPASVRPSSSRPGAPRPRDKFENILTESDSILVGKVNIITESSPNEEEEDSSIVIVDDTITEQHQKESESIHLTANGHGHLVQQILDSQRELSQVTGKTEIEWQFGAQKARETINQEVEQIRYNIQAMSRAANPLGKLLDHLQEDVEIMRQELQQWTATYEKSAKEVSKQKSINEESLLPLHTKLKQLAADTQEKHSKINDLKVIIQKNSQRIEKLLASGNVQ